VTGVFSYSAVSVKRSRENIPHAHNWYSFHRRGPFFACGILRSAGPFRFFADANISGGDGILEAERSSNTSASTRGRGPGDSIRFVHFAAFSRYGAADACGAKHSAVEAGLGA